MTYPDQVRHAGTDKPRTLAAPAAEVAPLEAARGWFWTSISIHYLAVVAGTVVAAMALWDAIPTYNFALVSFREQCIGSTEQTSYKNPDELRCTFTLSTVAQIRTGSSRVQFLLSS